MQLNASQQKAVTHVNGPLLVLAGPGSGKTRVITERTKYLIETKKILPETILVVSFSRASAKEMKERFMKESHLRTTRVYFSTFHSLFFRILREFGQVNKEDVLNEQEKYSILVQWRKRYYKGHFEDGSTDLGMQEEEISKCVDEIEHFNSKNVSLENYVPEFLSKKEAESMLLFYEKVKQYNHKIDFHDMEEMCLKLLTSEKSALAKLQERFHYFMIDEFQDINEISFQILNLLVGSTQNLVAVGDEDQSIYEFRGASPRIMLDFNQYYPTAIRIHLEENYRSSFSILTLSQRVIKQNQMRYTKKIAGQKEKLDNGVHIHKVEDETQQSQWMITNLKKKMESGFELVNEAVLFRNHASGSFLAGQFYEHGIPFSFSGYLPDLYKHFIGKDILAYFSVASSWQGGWILQDFLRISNKPLRYISPSIFTQNSPSWEGIMKYYYEDKKDWMCQRMEEFRGDLKHLSFLNPYAGIQYIRKVIGYDQYLENLAGNDLEKKEQWKEILNNITAFSKAFSTVSDWKDGIEGYRKTLQNPHQEDGIWLMTIHASKGLEFEQVYLIDTVDGIMPYKKAMDQGKIEEERRLFYVALTRAKSRIDILVPKKRNSHEVGISRFITEMKKK